MASLKNVRVVLVRPLYGGNLGSVCRAMKNMNVSELALVSPNPDMNFAEAQTMAVHAVDILEKRTQFDTLADAVADCALVAGTTARKGLYRNHARTPREWAPVLLDSARANKVALVFGTEDDGLSNEELAICTHVMRIPSSPRYSSLNLAQAVLICCYEMYLASGQYEPPQEAHAEARVIARERMMEMWREMLREIGFFDEGKEEHMMMGFRRIFSRGKLTDADIAIMMGVARQARWAAKHPKS